MKRLYEIKRVLVCAAALALLGTLFSGCEEEKKSYSKKVTPAKKIAKTTPAVKEAVPPINDSDVASKMPAWFRWPPIPKGNTVKLAKDLFARNFFIILDASGSMEGKKCSGGKTKIDAAKVALKSFAGKVPADANLGLIVFGSRGIQELVTLDLDNRDDFNSRVYNMLPGGGTPLYSAIELAYHKLKNQGVKQMGYGEYNLVVVTDGEANKGEDPTPIVNKILSESPVVIHTIGFCIGDSHSLNQKGRIIYKAANNPEDLAKGLEDTLAESPDFDITDFN